MPSALIVSEYGALNGGENSLLAVVPAIIDSGWNMHALVPADSPFANALRDANVSVMPFEFTADGIRKPLEALRQELAQEIQRFDSAPPRIVHCNSLSATRICAPVCAELDVPVVGYFRDIMKLGNQAIKDVNCADRIVAVSQATRDWHVQQGVDESRIQVIHNGVDPNIFFPGEDMDATGAELRSQLKVPLDSPIVLYVGQIGLRKGLNTWLAAAEKISEAIPQTHFLIVGERHSNKQESIDYERDLRQQSNSGQLNGKVHWIGRRTDVPHLMRLASVLLHSARQEPLGRVLLEASASALPIVATNVGGTSEILASEMLADCLIPADDAGAAANATIKLLSDVQLHRRNAHEVRRLAVEQFSISACHNQLTDVYQELVASGNSE